MVPVVVGRADVSIGRAKPCEVEDHVAYDTQIHRRNGRKVPMENPTDDKRMIEAQRHDGPTADN
jgi:hypothetical protein